MIHRHFTPTLDAAPLGSYPTFWDAIPVDPPAEPERPRYRPAPTEDPGPVFLSVEQADVG